MGKKSKKKASERAYAHLGVAPAEPSGKKGGVGKHSAPVGRHAAQPQASADSSDEGGAGRRKHRGLLRLCVALGMLAAVYLIGVGVFSLVFYPQTTLGGQDVSLRMVSGVAGSDTASAEDYVLTVKASDGGTFEVKGSDVDLRLDADTFVRDVLSQQNPWAWPWEVFASRTINEPARASFDEDELASLVKKQVDAYNETATPPTDATAAYNADTGLYEITPEVAGTALDADAVLEDVSHAVASLKSSLTLDAAAYASPAVTKDDAKLSKAVEEVNSHLGATQELTVDGTKVAEVGKDLVAQWVTVGDDLSMSVDTDAITAWCQGDLSEQLDTVGTTRNYSTPDGKTYSVTGGEYGWCIDGAALAASIPDAIEAGQSGSIDVPMKQTAAVWADGGADWGTRWVDVNITTQHATFYDNGSVIWESDVVSGKSSDGHDTPQGVYQVNGNMSSVESGSQVKLVSPEKDESTGEPTYISYVDYWMPFVGNLVAFHDASWRSSFGGTVYQYNGSHGCVNLPAAKAKELYHIIKVGDVVVVHA